MSHHTDQRGEDTMAGKKAAIYARISADPTGSALGVTDQIADGEKLATSLGWSVVERSIENDTSAYRKRRVLVDGEVRYRVVRPMFADLLAAARAGQVEAIVVHDLDRMVRDPRDLEDLIEVVEHHGVEVHSVTGSLNLRSDGEVTMARVLVAMANKSSRDTSRRVSRAVRRNAEAGRAHGGRRTFGFRVEKVEGGPSRLVHVPEEAEAIREAIDAVLAGSSIYSVARRWDAAGLPRVYGGLWAGATSKLTLVLCSWKNAGVVSLKGEPLDGVVATWEPIVTREKLDAVRALLLNPARRTNGGRPARKSSVSGLLRCGACGSPMRSTTHNGSRKLDPQRKVGRVAAYRCARPGCGMTVRAHRVDPVVLEAVVGELLHRDLAALAPNAADGSRMVELQAELAQISEANSDLAVALAERLLTLSHVREARQGLEARERAVQGELAGITRRFAAAQFLQRTAVGIDEVSDVEADRRADGVMERFCALDLGQRRAIVEQFVEVVVQSGHGHGRVQVFSRSTGERIDRGWPSGGLAFVDNVDGE